MDAPDLLVVGGGAAGLSAARTGRRLGASVVLVSDGEPGGECTFTGCVPSKTLLAATALLEENPDPTEDEVRWALSGNLCRCTGYQNIVKSVLWAAKKMRGEDPQAAPTTVTDEGAES